MTYRNQDTRPLSAIQRDKANRSNENGLPAGLALTFSGGFLFLVCAWSGGFLGSEVCAIVTCIVCTLGLFLSGMGLGQLLVQSKQGDRTR